MKHYFYFLVVISDPIFANCTHCNIVHKASSNKGSGDYLSIVPINLSASP
ncbi:hypothetical protein IFVP69_C2160005 [Vibrio parahaemolyticus]